MNGELVFSASLQADHIRNGIIIDTRSCEFREPNGPGFLEFKESSWFKNIFNKARDINSRSLKEAYKLLSVGPYNLVTTTGVNYMAAAFAAGSAISNFNYHASGTGQNSGGTHTPGTATNATPIVVTDTAHGYTLNDIITIASYTGNTGANGIWQISPVTTNTYTLLGSVGNGSSGGSPTSQRLNGAGDTALVTDSGVARVAGTQTTPGSVNIYKTVATQSYVSSLAIIEWGLFSASSSGTLWDRRWFNTTGAPATTASSALTVAAINVISGDSIQFTYQLTCNAGGT